MPILFLPPVQEFRNIFTLLSFSNERVTISDWSRAPQDVDRRRPGSLNPSFPSLKSLRTSLFSPITFVVGEQTSGIKSRSLRTKPRNLETLFGWVIKLCLRTSDNYSSNDWRILRRRRFGKFSALRIDVRFKNKSDYRLSIRNGVSWLKSN